MRAAILVGAVITAMVQEPTAERIPGPFRAYVVFGGSKPKSDVIMTADQQNYADATREGKFHCLVTRSGLDPTVAVFVRGEPPAEGQPLAKLIGELDAAAVKHPNSRLKTFAVFLGLRTDFLRDDTRAAQIGAIKEFAAKAGLKVTPLALDEIESDRTQSFKIDGESNVTVVVFENQVILKRFAFTADKPLDDDGVRAVMAEVEAIVKRK